MEKKLWIINKADALWLPLVFSLPEIQCPVSCHRCVRISKNILTHGVVVYSLCLNVCLLNEDKRVWYLDGELVCRWRGDTLYPLTVGLLYATFHVICPASRYRCDGAWRSVFEWTPLPAPPLRSDGCFIPSSWPAPWPCTKTGLYSKLKRKSIPVAVLNEWVEIFFSSYRSNILSYSKCIFILFKAGCAALAIQFSTLANESLVRGKHNAFRKKKLC